MKVYIDRYGAYPVYLINKEKQPHMAEVELTEEFISEFNDVCKKYNELQDKLDHLYENNLTDDTKGKYGKIKKND